jgi:hypothetical protein
VNCRWVWFLASYLGTRAPPGQLASELEPASAGRALVAPDGTSPSPMASHEALLSVGGRLWEQCARGFRAWKAGVRLSPLTVQSRTSDVLPAPPPLGLTSPTADMIPDSAQSAPPSRCADLFPREQIESEVSPRVRVSVVTGSGQRRHPTCSTFARSKPLPLMSSASSR